MTAATPSLPEVLLDLAAGFTRHNDALSDLILNGVMLNGPAPAAILPARIPAAQDLARAALDAIGFVKSQHLYRSADVRDAEVRLKQLAALTIDAADHLIDAADIIEAARAQAAGSIDVDRCHSYVDAVIEAARAEEAGKTDVNPYHSYVDAFKEARRRLDLARELTALAPEASVMTAEAVAVEMRRQRPNAPSLVGAAHTPLSPTQHTALRATARGQIEIYATGGKPYVSLRDDRLPITTIRALESKDLIQRYDRPNAQGRQRLYLTATGRQTLIAAAGRPQPAASRTRPATKPTLATRATARTR